MSHVEFDFSPSVAQALDAYAPSVPSTGDWVDVVRRARPVREPRRRRWFIVAAAAAALLILVLATPLGGAIRGTVDDFSAWLRGEPGQPATPEEQRAFDEENARSYAAFPGSPELRRLIRTEVDGVQYDLLGFRSGNSLCIRIRATGAAAGSTIVCAPVADLRHDDAPVRVLVADWPVGQGAKRTHVGFDTYRAPLARVTAGIAADDVRSIEVVDDSGTHTVDVAANSFLYVASQPDVEQRVTHVRAELADGTTVGVPFTIAPSAAGGGFGGAAGTPGGPTHVERVVHGGAIGWLDRREERGEPLDSLPNTPLIGEPEFGRVITPDPQSEKRIAIMVATPTFGPGKGQRTVCFTVISRGGAEGGCAGRPGRLFEEAPFTIGYSLIGAGDQYATFSGIASDDVARLELFTAAGDRVDVALHDNGYLAEVAAARLPAKLVAYDAEGRVIGIRQTPREESPATIVGAPVFERHVTADGSTLSMRAYRTREGGHCWFARGSGSAETNAGACVPKEWTFAPVRLNTLGNPAIFVYGQVRDDVKTVILRYADGDEQRLTPEEGGFVLEVVPPEHRAAGSAVSSFAGVDAGGHVVAQQRLLKPPARQRP